MPGAIDWERVYAEALEVLVRYIRIDSSNPPGNEAAAARFLGALIEAEGIECAYLETAPGREIVLLAAAGRRRRQAAHARQPHGRGAGGGGAVDGTGLRGRGPGRANPRARRRRT